MAFWDPAPPPSPARTWGSVLAGTSRTGETPARQVRRELPALEAGGNPAQQLVGKSGSREASVWAGRAAREFLAVEGGLTYPKEQCEGQWQLLTVEQKIAVHRGGFMDGCMNPA